MEKAAGVDGGRCLGVTCEVAAMAGWCVRQCKAGGGVGAENPKLSHYGSVSGRVWTTAGVQDSVGSLGRPQREPKRLGVRSE
jgi:hypothetical protein